MTFKKKIIFSNTDNEGSDAHTFGFSFGDTCCNMKMKGSKNHHGFKFSGQHRSHQLVSDGNLEVYILVPGLEKNSLKIRAKNDKLTVKADYLDLPIFKGKKAHIIEELAEDVIPDSAKAKYSDGVLKITFPLAEPGYEVSDVE